MRLLTALCRAFTCHAPQSRGRYSHVSQPQKSPHEEFIIVAIIIGLFLAIAFCIWHFFHVQLTTALRWIRVSEMWLVAQIMGESYAVNVPGIGPQKLEVWRQWLPGADVGAIGFPEIRVSTYLGVLPLRIVFAGILGLMALWTMFRGPGTQYRRRMNLEALIKEQARSFPVIAPFVKFDPRKQAMRVPGQAVPSKLPLFAEALSPEEWVAFHGIRYQGNQLDINKSWQALGQQLGQRWRGPLKLSPHAQALYAAFALRHVRKRRESEDLLNRLSLLWTAEKGMPIPLKMRGEIRKVIKDPKVGGKLQPYADQHAFETTALLRCLARARNEGGVLAPASFIWLRAADRNLWYPLNNLGRKSYHAEAAGALVHYSNELIAGQKIPTPRFEDVIRAFESFLRGPDARPIPPLQTVSKPPKVVNK